jgi:hypothetical protein
VLQADPLVTVGIVTRRELDVFGGHDPLAVVVAPRLDVMPATVIAARQPVSLDQDAVVQGQLLRAGHPRLQLLAVPRHRLGADHVVRGVHDHVPVALGTRPVLGVLPLELRVFVALAALASCADQPDPHACLPWPVCVAPSDH